MYRQVISGQKRPIVRNFLPKFSEIFRNETVLGEYLLATSKALYVSAQCRVLCTGNSLENGYRRDGAQLSVLETCLSYRKLSDNKVT